MIAHVRLKVEGALASEIVAGWMSEGEAAELRQRLALLAFNITDVGCARVVSEELANAWLFHARDRYDPADVAEREYLLRKEGRAHVPAYREPEATLDERASAARLLHLAQGASLLSNATVNVQFADQSLQFYFCAQYCSAQPLTAQLLDRTTKTRLWLSVWPFWSELDADLFDSLVALIRGNAREEMRANAVSALGGLREERAFALLVDAFRHETRKNQDEFGLVRPAAALALGTYGDRRSVELLINALNDNGDDGFVRKNSATALGEIGDDRAVEPLLSALERGRFGLTRTAVIALGKLGDRRAVEPIIVILQETPGDWMRIPAVQALGRLGDPRAVEPLIDVLLGARETWHHPRRGIRNLCTEIASALGGIGDVRALPALARLQQAIDGQDQRAERIVADAIERISHRPGGGGM